MVASTWLDLSMNEKRSRHNTSIHNRHTAGKGEFILREGDTGNEAYLIQSGRVRVYATHNGEIRELATLGPGEIFGEMALVIDEPRAATVEALENTTLVKITRAMMIEKMAKSDVTVQALMKMMIARVKEANDRALNKQASFDDLSSVVIALYDDLHNRLSGSQKASLKRDVKPNLDAFLESIKEFNDRYS
jgi:CRP-like cAMP-binding protein